MSQGAAFNFLFGCIFGLELHERKVGIEDNVDQTAVAYKFRSVRQLDFGVALWFCFLRSGRKCAEEEE